MIEKQFNIIYGILVREYERFKRAFPGDEPFWKISCLKKHQRPIISRSELKENWRAITTSNNQTKVDVIEEVKLEKIRRKEIVTVKQERVKTIQCDTGKVIRDKPLTKREKYTEIIEEEFVTETYKSVDHPFLIDSNVHLDDPKMIDVIQLSEDRITCSNKILAIWGEFAQSYGVIIKDGQKLDIESSVTDKIKKICTQTSELLSKQADEMKALAEENHMLRARLSDTKEFNIKELTHIKQDWTVQEIINKYVDCQKKLTLLKVKVTPILEKHSDLGYLDLVKRKGFISSFIDVVKYFDDHYDSDDHLSDFD